MRVYVWCCPGCGTPLEWVPPLREPLYCCDGCRTGQCTCQEIHPLPDVGAGGDSRERSRLN